MLSYLPNAHELSGVAGLAAGAVAVPCPGRRGHRAPAPCRRFQLAAGWGVACLVLTAWGVLTPWSLRWVPPPRWVWRRPRGWRAPAGASASAPGRADADAPAYRAVLAGDALGVAVADRHLAQPAAECGLPVRPRPAADRAAAAQLLASAGRALQHPVRRLPCLAGVRRLRRRCDGAVQRRTALRRGPAAGPRACRHGRGQAALVGLRDRAAVGGDPLNPGFVPRFFYRLTARHRSR